MDSISTLIQTLNSANAAESENIMRVEKQIKYEFPNDYTDFLKISNGAEGFLGDSYINLWSVEDLPTLNESYQVNIYAPGLILFGSNGGGEAFALDTRSETITYVQVPFIGMDLESIEEISDSFLGFLNYFYCL